MPACVAEVVRPVDGTEEIWHLANGPAVDDATFQAIACSEEEGIVMPGPQYNREPTCPDCLRLCYAQ